MKVVFDGWVIGIKMSVEFDNLYAQTYVLLEV